MCLGGAIGSCAGSFAGACATGVLSSFISFKRVENAVAVKVLYAFGIMLGAALSYLFYLKGDAIFPSYVQTHVCAGSCLNYFSVFKVSLGMVLYHSFLALVLFGVSSRDNARAFFQDGIWPIKTLLWLGSIIGCFFIKDEAYLNYWIACVVFGAIFIIFQAVILVDFVWSLADNWVSKYEEGENGFYKFLLIASTFICLGGTIALTAVLYRFFAQKPGCGLNTFFITFNLLLCVIVVLLSISPKVQEVNPKSGLLQAAFISIYLTYLVGSAVSSEPVSFCAESSTANASLATVMLYAGIVFTIISLGYAAFSVGSADVFNGNKDVESGAGKDGESSSVDLVYNYSFFHFVFVMAAFYLAAVLTSWTQLAIDPATNRYMPSNDSFAPTWVKVSFGWVTALLYIWTLVAPILFPDRDFS